MFYKTEFLPLLYAISLSACWCKWFLADQATQEYSRSEYIEYICVLVLERRVPYRCDCERNRELNPERRVWEQPAAWRRPDVFTLHIPPGFSDCHCYETTSCRFRFQDKSRNKDSAIWHSCSSHISDISEICITERVENVYCMSFFR